MLLKIAYGINGVGFGHTSRSKRVIDELLNIDKNIEIMIFTSFGSYNFFREVYTGNTRVKVNEIWAIDMKLFNGMVSNFLTFLFAFPEIIYKKKRTKELAEKLLNEKIDLVITDFEPYIPRASKLAKIPFISINHQMFLRYGKIKLWEIPLFQLWSWFSTKFVVKNFQPVSDTTIVTSFFKVQEKDFHGVFFVEPILRKIITDAKPRDDNFILVYPKTPNEDIFLKIVYSMDNYDFIVYVKEPTKYIEKYGIKKNIVIKKISNTEFINDLQRCSFVFSNAGHQLASESLFLKKPMLVLPESAQFEQFYNAMMIEKMGFGRKVNIRKIKPEILSDFAKNIEFYKNNLRKNSVVDGTQDTMNIIKRKIGQMDNL